LQSFFGSQKRTTEFHIVSKFLLSLFPRGLKIVALIIRKLPPIISPSNSAILFESKTDEMDDQEREAETELAADKIRNHEFIPPSVIPRVFRRLSVVCF
jgi:hypothetical protein